MFSIEIKDGQIILFNFRRNEEIEKDGIWEGLKLVTLMTLDH